MENETAFLIDIERILKQKAGTKASFVPKFVVSYLKRIIHQDEVNDILTRTADKKGVPFLEACMKELDVKIEVEGKENLPTEGLCTFVSNHPLGGLDGISLGWLLGTHYDGRIKYIVNDLLMNLHGLAPLCIPVNKTGGQSRALPQMIEEKLLGSGVLSALNLFVMSVVGFVSLFAMSPCELSEGVLLLPKYFFNVCIICGKHLLLLGIRIAYNNKRKFYFLYKLNQNHLCG